MNHRNLSEHRLRNGLQSVLLIGAMALLLAFSSRLLLFGAEGWLWVFAGVILLMISLPNLSPMWLLHLYRAKRIPAGQGYPITRILQHLSQRARLPQTPELFWIPSNTLNAFTVGRGEYSAIAVTDGLLGRLTGRELAAVLAHEISHIKHHDLRIMTLADMMTRLTHLLSMTGLLTMLITFPLQLMGHVSISTAGLLLLMILPGISTLLQLGLSRVREFDADLGAARLTGDPAALASALARIEQRPINLWQRIFLPGYRDQQPSVLRSHPHTGERIKRLMDLQQASPPFAAPLFDTHAGNVNCTPSAQVGQFSLIV